MREAVAYVAVMWVTYARVNDGVYEANVVACIDGILWRTNEQERAKEGTSHFPSVKVMQLCAYSCMRCHTDRSHHHFSQV
jgi:hypothetical protein